MRLTDNQRRQKKHNRKNKIIVTLMSVAYVAHALTHQKKKGIKERKKKRETKENHLR